MKLIIREYLASLGERNELDALLPDLLSQMGLDVFSKPSVGGRQYGVDVAAFGRIDGGPDKVFLFSIKSGNLGRSDWNSGSLQNLAPSLDEIRDAYIPTHLPVQYGSYPVEICICFGGDLKETVRLNVSAYEKKYSSDLLSFSEWGGEKLAGYIEEYFLREELLPDQYRRMLRKSLAMLDEPDVSYRHFRQLVCQLSKSENQKPKDTLRTVRQLYLCLWILYAWCREADNLESAYLCSEFSLLNAWEISKAFLGKRDKGSKAILETLDSIQSLHIQISRCFMEEKILPHAGKLHALSHAVNPSCSLDVNLKIFDILGRLAQTGLWLYWLLLEEVDREDRNEESVDEYIQLLDQYEKAILLLIQNNPMLHAPYKDEQAVDIGLAALFISLNPLNLGKLHGWLQSMIGQIHFAFRSNTAYPCNLDSYHKLLEHPVKGIESYREEVTKGSILYPLVSFLSAVHGFDDVYSQIKKIKADFLEHCNFQIWFPGKDTEEHYYKNMKRHGAVFSHISVDKVKDVLLDEIYSECDASNEFYTLSSIENLRGPIVLLASRHYRLPVPFHFFKPEGLGSGPGSGPGAVRNGTRAGVRPMK